MDVFPVNWDSVPEVMNKEQFFRICHISKSTALHLLKSGKVKGVRFSTLASICHHLQCQPGDLLEYCPDADDARAASDDD